MLYKVRKPVRLYIATPPVRQRCSLLFLALGQHRCAVQSESVLPAFYYPSRRGFFILARYLREEKGINGCSKIFLTSRKTQKRPIHRV